MKLTRHRFSKLTALILLVVAVLLVLRGHYPSLHHPRNTVPAMQTAMTTRARLAPITGLSLYDTHGEVPGGPQNGVDGLKRMYQLMLIYRRNNDGRYPADEIVLFLDIVCSPQKYGFQDVKDFLAKMNNPDSRFSDSEGLRRASHSMPYSFSSTRLDGTGVGAPKATGTRDVLGSTGIYYHANQVLYPNKPFTMKPVGFYEVLWDDGSVEKIPYDQTLQVPVSDPTEPQTREKYRLSPETPILSTRLGFRGQAGLPPGAIGYSEFYAKFKHK